MKCKGFVVSNKPVVKYIIKKINKFTAESLVFVAKFLSFVAFHQATAKWCKVLLLFLNFSEIQQYLLNYLQP